MAEIKSRRVLTIGTGKRYYVDLAANLARSFLYWHKGSDIIFQLVTDQPEMIPEDIRSSIQVMKISPGKLGEGFSTKLHLDKVAVEGQTLFIDSDCLIFGNLDFVFDRFSGHDVSVVGSYIREGEWFGDVRSICLKFKVEHLPKFNGGIYYLEKGLKASAIYQRAREIEKNYDEIGFVRLRSRPNDEVIMSLAMQLHGQTPIDDDGTIMSDPQACQGGYKIDVIKGERRLYNPPPPNSLHQNWYPFENVSPVIVHFLGHYTNHHQYKREVFRLSKALVNRLDIWSGIYSFLAISATAIIKIRLKNIIRPFYHYLFGKRKIKTSERI